MNQLHHIELSPLCLHNAPRLPPVPNQPQTRMDTGFSPFAPTALTTSAGSNRIARRNVPGVAIRGPVFSFSAACPSCGRRGNRPTTASIWRGLQGRSNGGKQPTRHCAQRGPSWRSHYAALNGSTLLFSVPSRSPNSVFNALSFCSK